ncbi:MAG: YaaA family protein, partial [Nocardioides sp.]
MLILLPPSEGKTAPARGKALDLSMLSHPVLTDVRRRVVEALGAVSAREDAADLLGIGHTQLDLLARNRVLETAPTARADRVYTGVLYDSLGFESLSPAARRRSATRVAVTSSVFGLVRPTDRIPAYRLSGDTTLPGLGPVAGVWRDVLGDAVRESLGDGLLVDLRSGTYAAFWRPPADL